MLRPFAAPALVLALAALAPAAHAQTALRLGQTVSGSLSASDPVLPATEGAHYDAYTIRASADGPVTVSMRSTAFDAYLYVGTGSGGDLEPVCTDDDSYPGAGLDARCVVEMRSGQTLTVNASSLSSAEGAYTILAEAGAGALDTAYEDVEGPAEMSDGPVVLENTRADALGANGPVRAAHADGGPTFTQGSTTYPYRLYRIAVRAGQTMTFDVSADFDAMLRLGLLDGRTFASIASNDDTNGLNPQIVHTFDTTGDAFLLVTGYNGTSGPFTIEARVGDFAYVEPDLDGPLAVNLARVRGVSVGSETQGDIGLEDEQGGILADVYRLRATRSGPVTIALTTGGESPFDGYLSAGRLDGSTFTALQSDDDSGIGVNPLLVVEMTAGQEIGIVVRAYAPQARGAQSAMGPYTLAVREGDLSREYADPVESPFSQELDFSTAHPLAVGAAVRGTLGASSPVARQVSDDEGEARYELYSLPVGLSGAYTFSVEADFDASLELGTREGDRIATVEYDDDSGVGVNPAFVATLNPNEAFFLVVRGFNGASGDFSIRVQEGDQGESVIEDRMPDRVDMGRAVPLRIGREVTGTLADSDASGKPWGSPVDLYTLSAEAGESLVITLTKTGSGEDAIDPYVEIGTVENGVFTQLGSNDDGGENLNSRLEYSVMTTRQHVVRVSSINRNTGGYRLTVARN